MEKKKEYVSPTITVVIFKDFLLQGEWIPTSSPSDDFSKGNRMEFEEEDDLPNSVWGYDGGKY